MLSRRSTLALESGHGAPSPDLVGDICNQLEKALGRDVDDNNRTNLEFLKGLCRGKTKWLKDHCTGYWFELQGEGTLFMTQVSSQDI